MLKPGCAFLFMERNHLRLPLEATCFGGLDAQKSRTKSQRGERSGLDVLVDLLSAYRPILRELVNRHVRMGMIFKTDND